MPVLLVEVAGRASAPHVGAPCGAATAGTLLVPFLVSENGNGYNL